LAALPLFLGEQFFKNTALLGVRFPLNLCPELSNIGLCNPVGHGNTASTATPYELKTKSCPGSIHKIP
jgi:hypothetical protein